MAATPLVLYRSLTIEIDDVHRSLPREPFEPTDIATLITVDHDTSDLCLPVSIHAPVPIAATNVSVERVLRFSSPGAHVLLCALVVDTRLRPVSAESIARLARHTNVNASVVSFAERTLPVTAVPCADSVEIWIGIPEGVQPGESRVVLRGISVAGLPVSLPPGTEAGALVDWGLSPPFTVPKTCQRGHVTPAVSARGMLVVPQVSKKASQAPHMRLHGDLDHPLVLSRCAV
jgi:hypothetical protein